MDTAGRQIGQSLPPCIADRTLGNPPHFFLLVQKETGWSLASEAARCIPPPRRRAVSISAPGFFLFQTQVKLAFGT